MKKDKNSQTGSANTRSLSYRKEVYEQKTTSKIKQSFFHVSTNITYKVGGGMNFIRSFFTGSNQPRVIWLHGKKFASEAEAKEYIKQLIWFSYRRIPGLCKQFHADTGWGCLIRVGQMALASGLKQYFSKKGNQRKTQKSVIMNNIIVAFVQKGGKYEKYSLQKIVQKASKKFKLNYGQWFNTMQICQVLVSLHNKNPMKGSQNLILVHFKESTIFIDQVFNKMNKKMCSCKKLRICCGKCDTETIVKYQPKQIQTMLSRTMTKTTHKFESEKVIKSSIFTKITIPEKKLLVFVSCRLGMQKINPVQYQQLIEVLGLECSLGIVGGVPQRGYYFVGYEDDRLIYLDPHLVQEEITLSNINQKIKQFQFTEIRKAKRQQIDPQMAFVFFIDCLQTLEKLYDKAYQMRQKYENPIICTQWFNQYHRGGQYSNIEELEEVGSNSLDNSFIQEL